MLNRDDGREHVAGASTAARRARRAARARRPLRRQLTIPPFPPPSPSARAPRRQAGRFSQVVVLNANPAGGFYIKADICRWSVGANKEAHNDPTALGKNFVQQYYSLYPTSRPSLAAFYHESKAQLTFEKAQFVGRAAIAEKLPSLPPGSREIDSLDSTACLDAPVGGVGPAVVALVTGRILLEDQTNPLAYMQVFLLAVEGGAPSCVNEIFSFNYS